MTRSQRPVWLGEDSRGWDHARIHRQLLEDDRLGVYEIGVYVGLAIHAETMTGSCRPAAATLAGYIKCGERRAREALDRLEAAGYIAVDVCVGKASTYRLLRPPTLAPDAGVANPDPGTSGLPTPASGAGHPGTTRRGTPARGADEQEPVNENQEGEPVNEAAQSPASLPLLALEPAPSALSVQETFEMFWQRYPKRDGRRDEKAAALTQWRRLSVTDRGLAYRNVQHYAAACDAEIKRAKDAHRWLRDHLWVEWEDPPDLSFVRRNGNGNGSRSAVLSAPDQPPIEEAWANLYRDRLPAAPAQAELGTGR